jgi:hypothetical protein
MLISTRKLLNIKTSANVNVSVMWSPSIIETVTVILHDNILWESHPYELILGSRDSDYFLYPRMILAKDVPYCMINMNNMTVKERIFLMENM